MQSASKKEIILKTLKSGNWISGEVLAIRTGITRTGVWKHIQGLKQEGYQIKSQNGLGYKLLAVPDKILPHEIRTGLKTKILGTAIEYQPSVPSTQELAWELALQGAPEGTIVLAEQQTNGRGRLTRSWQSLPGAIALSLILRPRLAPDHLPIFPLLTGVTMAQAINQETALNCQLKWPNDLMVGNKKIGGILSEVSAEPDQINFLIIGLGLNVNTPPQHIPHDLKDKATSLYLAGKQIFPRSRIIQSFLERFEKLFDLLKSQGPAPILEQWKALNNTLGKEVEIMRPSGSIHGLAKGIDNKGQLILELSSGALETIIAGDVKVHQA